MFRTERLPQINGKFRTGRHSCQIVQKAGCQNRVFQQRGLFFFLSRLSFRDTDDQKDSMGREGTIFRKVKKNLKVMDLSSTGVASLVYINDSLCEYYKMIWWKCKKLCK